MKHDSHFKLISLTTIWVWLSFFVLFAFCITIVASFLSQTEGHIFTLPFTFGNYTQIFSTLYLKIFLKSVYLALLCTALCLLLGYPFAYILARMNSKHKDVLLLMLVIPFWTSSLIRSYAIIGIIKTKGLLNSFLLSIGLIHHPLQILFTNTAVITGLVYNLLPFMILPLYSNLEKLDMRLIEAAKDLGADTFTIFKRVIIPLSVPGIISGTILVLLPAMTLFYIPDLLGGAKSLLIGNLIEYQFLVAHNWPLGSAVSVLLTALMAIMLLAYWLSNKRTGRKEFNV